MISQLDALKDPLHVFDMPGLLTGGVNFATVVFIFGGAFIMYTAFKDITHMLTIHNLGHDVETKRGKSAAQVVGMIVLMNLIFSFDSVLSAVAITDVFPVLAIAIIISGIAMLAPADGVTHFCSATGCMRCWASLSC